MSTKKRINPLQPELVLESESTSKFRSPSLYRVYLMNDDYTPMDFVVDVLERYFSKDTQSAQEIMLKVHQMGSEVCGLYTQEIAETKVVQVNEYARRNQFPLLCRMEGAG